MDQEQREMLVRKVIMIWILHTLKQMRKTDKDYFSDELAFKWSQNLSVKISVIDINQAPIPLAYSVINDGKVILCRNYLRLHSDEARIWSMWESYKYEYAIK